MPFNPTGSVISTDLDNMLRGLYRDNSDSTVANTVAETILKNFVISGNTISGTGLFRILAVGSIIGVNGTKTLRLKFGTTTIATTVQAAGTTSDWYFDAWCFNTATNQQRWFVQRNTNDALTSSFDYSTSSEDTAQNKTLSVTVQLGNSGDSVTQSIFTVLIAQIN